MKCLIHRHHVLYTCTDCMNISTFVTVSRRYLNFALSCANSDLPEDTVPMSPTTYKQKKNLPNIYISKITLTVIIIIIIIISKSFRKYISNIPGNHEVKELQKRAILGTAHILWKVLT